MVCEVLVTGTLALNLITLTTFAPDLNPDLCAETVSAAVRVMATCPSLPDRSWCTQISLLQPAHQIALVTESASPTVHTADPAHSPSASTADLHTPVTTPAAAAADTARVLNFSDASGSLAPIFLFPSFLQPVAHSQPIYPDGIKLCTTGCFLCGKVPDRASRTVPFLLHSFTGPVLNPDLASLPSCLSTICGQPVDDALIVTAINATMLAHKLMHVPYACPTCVNSFTFNRAGE